MIHDFSGNLLLVINTNTGLGFWQITIFRVRQRIDYEYEFYMNILISEFDAFVWQRPQKSKVKAESRSEEPRDERNKLLRQPIRTFNFSTHTKLIDAGASLQGEGQGRSASW